VAAALMLAAGGCGFVRAGGASPVKPDGFVLRGYVSVSGATAGEPGSACGAPPAVHVWAGAPVRVSDAGGHPIAAGTLGAGVRAEDSGRYRCDFPFEIPAVPGGHDTYLVAVSDRAPVSFAAREVRADAPAVIPVPGAS
jgi:hypothetical protein